MDELLQVLLGPFSGLVILLTIVYGGWKRWWVFGWHYAEVTKERDEWKAIAMRGTKIAETVTTALADSNGPTTP